MTEYEVESPCECGGILGARLNAERQVITGWARQDGESEKERSPAHTIGSGDRFDVAWWCPLCGRNTLRWFHVGALRRAAA